MRNIIIVDPVSTGYNFVADVTARGYYPVVIESNMLKGCGEDITDIMSKIACDYEFISEADTYEETLEMVKRYEPVLVLAGAESGVELTTRLAEDLGLPGNPVANLDKMRNKAAMQLAEKEAGIRYILGSVVSSVEEAEKFLKDNQLNMGVVKPLSGAGSNGVIICDNTEQVLNAVREGLNSKDYYGRQTKEILVQERIIGTEYIVNTMSCNGRHRVSSVFQCEKVRTDEGRFIYKGIFNIKKLEPKHDKLIEYALKTADAIGVKYGSVLGEYMVDEKGPVLIEVNCRPMGCACPAKYLDMMFEQHETDSVLNCYLDPEKFDLDAKKPYGAVRQGYIKLTVIPYEMEVESIPLWTIAENLRSVYYISISERDKVKTFEKTKDLETAGGKIFLISDDEDIVKADAALLRELEDDYFALTYSERFSRQWFVKKDGHTVNIREILNDLKLCGTILAVCENDGLEEIENVLTLSPMQALDNGYSFDNVILNFDQSLFFMHEANALRLIISIMRRTKEGGRIFVPESTYQYLTYGRKGMEMLMKVIGIEIDNDNNYPDNYVVGKRDYRM